MKIATVPFLEDLKRVTWNAYKLYYKTRSSASPDSHVAAKALLKKLSSVPSVHPVFKDRLSSSTLAQADMISAIRGYRPKQAHLALELPAFVGMKRRAAKKSSDGLMNSPATAGEPSAKPPAQAGDFRDDNFYMNYSKPSFDAAAAEDRGYSVKGDFASQANQAVFDLGFGDDLKRNSLLQNSKKKNLGNMDRQKLNVLSNQKRIKTEFGTSLPASFKTNMYEKWQKKTHLALPRVGDVELNSEKVAALAPKKRWASTRDKTDGHRQDQDGRGGFGDRDDRGGSSRGGISRGGSSRGGISRGGRSGFGDRGDRGGFGDRGDRGGSSRGGISRGGSSRGGISRGGSSRGGISRGGSSRGGSSRGGGLSRGGRGSFNRSN